MPKYYNVMINGTDRGAVNCDDIYDRLRGYNIFAKSSCGYGVDGDCNKRIRYDGIGGITEVRSAVQTVVNSLELDVDIYVNSKGKCIF